MTPTPERLIAALVDRYRIEREMGLVTPAATSRTACSGVIF